MTDLFSKYEVWVAYCALDLVPFNTYWSNFGLVAIYNESLNVQYGQNLPVFVSSKIDCSYFSRTLHHYARVGRLLLGSVQTGQANLLGQTPPVEHYSLLFRESVPHI